MHRPLCRALLFRPFRRLHFPVEIRDHLRYQRKIHNTEHYRICSVIHSFFARNISHSFSLSDTRISRMPCIDPTNMAPQRKGHNWREEGSEKVGALTQLFSPDVKHKHANGSLNKVYSVDRRIIYYPSVTTKPIQFMTRNCLLLLLVFLRFACGFILSFSMQ